jgi:hypothetical protein
MKASKGFFTKKPMMFVEHLGGKKLTQFGAEYVHKEKETRRHRTGGRPFGRHRPMG